MSTHTHMSSDDDSDSEQQPATFSSILDKLHTLLCLLDACEPSQRPLLAIAARRHFITAESLLESAATSDNERKEFTPKLSEMAAAIQVKLALRPQQEHGGNDDTRRCRENEDNDDGVDDAAEVEPSVEANMQTSLELLCALFQQITSPDSSYQKAQDDEKIETMIAARNVVHSIVKQMKEATTATEATAASDVSKYADVFKNILSGFEQAGILSADDRCLTLSASSVSQLHTVAEAAATIADAENPHRTSATAAAAAAASAATITTTNVVSASELLRILIATMVQLSAPTFAEQDPETRSRVLVVARERLVMIKSHLLPKPSDDQQQQRSVVSIPAELQSKITPLVHQFENLVESLSRADAKICDAREQQEVVAQKQKQQQQLAESTSKGSE